MFDVMADWLTVPLLNAEAGNQPPKRLGPRASVDRALWRVHAARTASDILISIQSEREWKKLCSDVLRQAGSAERSASVASGVERVKNRALHRQDRSPTYSARMTRDDLLETSRRAPTSPSRK